MESINDPIFHRVSVRQFLETPVESEKTERILRAAMASPSAVNQQPWEFYVVKDKTLLEQLASCSPYASCIAHAPQAIVPVWKTDCMLPEFAQIDLSIAMEHIWLEADLLGLGGVWLSLAPYEERMKKAEKILSLPKNHRAFALFPYGYPKMERAQQNRFDESRIHWI